MASKGRTTDYGDVDFRNSPIHLFARQPDYVGILEVEIENEVESDHRYDGHTIKKRFVSQGPEA